MNNLNELSQRIHAFVNTKWPDTWKDPNIGQIVMLMVSELGEAIDAHRKNKFDIRLDLIDGKENPKVFEYLFDYIVKGTVEEELADVFLRVLNYMAYLNIIDLSPKKYTPANTGVFGEYLLHINKRLLVLYEQSEQLHIDVRKQTVKCIAEDILFHIINVSKMIKCADLMAVIELKMKYNELSLNSKTTTASKQLKTY